MTATTPPPHPNGYQPVEGEGITAYRVRVKPNRGWQGTEVEAEYHFARPTSYSESLPALDSLFDQLNEDAQRNVDALITEREAYEAGLRGAEAKKVEAGRAAIADTPPPQAPAVTAKEHVEQLVRDELGGQPVTNGNGEPNWLWAEKANGKGNVRYLPESVLTEMELVNGAKEACAAQGLPADQVVVWDNRERLAQGKGYSAGAVKPRNDSTVQKMIGDEYIGDVEFHDDGSVKVYLNKHGQAAVNGLKAAANA